MKSNECDISILFKEVILDPSKTFHFWLSDWFFACINVYFFFLNVAKVWNDYEILDQMSWYPLLPLFA